jgi:hypothetical protein
MVAAPRRLSGAGHTAGAEADTFPMARSFDLDELARRVDTLRARYAELKVHL